MRYKIFSILESEIDKIPSLYQLEFLNKEKHGTMGLGLCKLKNSQKIPLQKDGLAVKTFKVDNISI